MVKNREINGTEKIALVTPTPVLVYFGKWFQTLGSLGVMIPFMWI